MSRPEREIWCDKPAWRGARTSLELFGIIAGVIGVALVLGEIWQMNRLSKIDKALDYVQRYAGAPLLDHRTQVAAVGDEINAGLRAIGEGAALTEAQKVVVLEAYFLSDSAAAEENRGSLMQIVRFYEEIAICEAQRLCHEQTVCQFFTAPARALRRDFGHVYETQGARAGLDGIGSGVTHIAELSCDNLFSPSE